MHSSRYHGANDYRKYKESKTGLRSAVHCQKWDLDSGSQNLYNKGFTQNATAKTKQFDPYQQEKLRGSQVRNERLNAVQSKYDKFDIKNGIDFEKKEIGVDQRESAIYKNGRKGLQCQPMIREKNSSSRFTASKEDDEFKFIEEKIYARNKSKFEEQIPLANNDEAGIYKRGSFLEFQRQQRVSCEARSKRRLINTRKHEEDTMCQSIQDSLPRFDGDHSDAHFQITRRKDFCGSNVTFGVDSSKYASFCEKGTLKSKYDDLYLEKPHSSHEQKGLCSDGHPSLSPSAQTFHQSGDQSHPLLRGNVNMSQDFNCRANLKQFAKERKQGDCRQQSSNQGLGQGDQSYQSYADRSCTPEKMRNRPFVSQLRDANSAQASAQRRESLIEKSQILKERLNRLSTSQKGTPVKTPTKETEGEKGFPKGVNDQIDERSSRHLAPSGNTSDRHRVTRALNYERQKSKENERCPDSDTIGHRSSVKANLRKVEIELNHTSTSGQSFGQQNPAFQKISDLNCKINDRLQKILQNYG